MTQEHHLVLEKSLVATEGPSPLRALLVNQPLNSIHQSCFTKIKKVGPILSKALNPLFGHQNAFKVGAGMAGIGSTR